jgi:hypothetical protein
VQLPQKQEKQLEQLEQPPQPVQPQLQPEQPPQPEQPLQPEHPEQLEQLSIITAPVGVLCCTFIKPVATYKSRASVVIGDKAAVSMGAPSAWFRTETTRTKGKLPVISRA